MSAPEGFPTLLRTGEVSEVLRMTPDAVVRLAKRGVLPGVEIGGALRFPADALLAFIRSGGAANREPAGV